MHPGKRLGATLGFVAVFAAFFLPFLKTAKQPWLALSINESLYGNAASTVGSFSSQRNSAISLLLVGAAVMIVAGGAFGVRPKAGAALGVTGMVAETLGRFLSSPRGGFSLASFGVGYPVLWATAVGTVGAMIWVRWDERAQAPEPAAKGWSR